MPGELINTLGGPHGFGENALHRNDDGYTSAIDITSVFPQGLNFFGTTWNQIYVNNNGNITFQSGLYQFTPGAIGTDYSAPIIAPFWGDVDTRGDAVEPTPGGNSAGTNQVWYDLDPQSGTVTVTWDDVGYFGNHTDKLNAFQLQLIDAGDGNFDMVFRYEDINWTTGDASGGRDGLGGQVARAGFSAGDGQNYYELYFSGDQNFMLGLEDTLLAGSDRPGTWEFPVRAGGVSGIGLENSDDQLQGSDGNDIMDGRSGNDTLFGAPGDDTMAGGLGDDILHGQSGNDILIGGPGDNRLLGGNGEDTALYAGIRNTLNISRSEAEGFEYEVLGDDFRDLLNNIEFIGFDDGRMSTDYAVEVRDNQEEFARFYNALFERLPDIDGLTYWVNDLVNGNSIQNAAQAFTESDEFQRLYGDDVAERDFVELLYQNILERAPDQAGYDYWLDEISATGNRGGMIVSFANSAEYIGNTQGEIGDFLAGVPLDGYILV
ncbi:MAG: nidogen-like domain-containing protein [Pseudomonadota bacterium]